MPGNSSKCRKEFSTTTIYIMYIYVCMYVCSMIRASQQRHADLEKENLELATSLAEKQKEVNRLLGKYCMHVCMYVSLIVVFAA